MLFFLSLIVNSTRVGFHKYLLLLSEWMRLLSGICIVVTPALSSQNIYKATFSYLYGFIFICSLFRLDTNSQCARRFLPKCYINYNSNQIHGLGKRIYTLHLTKSLTDIDENDNIQTPKTRKRYIISWFKLEKVCPFHIWHENLLSPKRWIKRRNWLLG